MKIGLSAEYQNLLPNEKKVRFATTYRTRKQNVSRFEGKAFGWSTKKSCMCGQKISYSDMARKLKEHQETALERQIENSVEREKRDLSRSKPLPLLG